MCKWGTLPPVPRREDLTETDPNPEDLLKLSFHPFYPDRVSTWSLEYSRSPNRMYNLISGLVIVCSYPMRRSVAKASPFANPPQTKSQTPIQNFW